MSMVACDRVSMLLPMLMGASCAVVADTYSPAVQWIWSISSPRWGIEAFYLSQVQAFDYMDISTGLSVYGYNSGEMWYSVAMIVYIGLGWETAALLALKLTHREKQK